MQVWTATKLAEHLDELAPLITPDRLRSVEASMVVWLLDRPRTVGQMSARMRRLIHAARAAAGVDCPRRDARDRRVWVEPAGVDGLATLMARLPETDALTVRAVLTAVAHDPTSPTDTRTREQRRADLLTTMITGAPATHGDPADVDLTPTSSPGSSGNPGGVGVQVTVTIPADTLTGGPTPGEVPGYGPLPATTTRDLAAHATSCRALVYHPDTGHLLGLSTLLHAGLPTTSDATAGDAAGGDRWRCAGSTGSHPPAGIRTRRSWNASPTPATPSVAPRAAPAQRRRATATTSCPTPTARQPRTTHAACADATTGSRPTPPTGTPSSTRTAG